MYRKPKANRESFVRSVPTEGMASSRIVSLAPSATATLQALGVTDRLVGVTAHCDADAPAVGGWLTPDYETITDLSPDLICTSDDLQREIRDDLRDRGFRVHHQEPSRLNDVLVGFESLADAAGVHAAGETLRAESQQRLDAIAERVPAGDGATDDESAAGGESGTSDDRPVVYCEEWSDPPMAAGNWVPDAVAAAGGRYPFVDPGERSQEVDGEAVVDADPDHAVLHICGTGDDVSADRFAERGWSFDAELHIVDDSLLNQPSPKLIDGIELLATRLHPDAAQKH